jgi:intergrase/recombinase
VGILLDRDAGFAGEHAGESVNRNSVRKYASRNKLLLPKYVRKVAWRLMIKVMPREVARFIQSRLGELHKMLDG